MTQNGMASREEWERTRVHQASKYSCAKCGERFATPEDVYEHLDTAHPVKREKGKAKR